MSEINNISLEDVTLVKVSKTREDDKIVEKICNKRKRSHEEQEEENDGFKTPTRPENKIPDVKECPPAPMKGESTYSMMLRGRAMSRRRWRKRSNFSPEDAIVRSHIMTTSGK
ncbi:unnamed protein product [Cochlearia groenlandica]